MKEQSGSCPVLYILGALVVFAVIASIREWVIIRSRRKVDDEDERFERSYIERNYVIPKSKWRCVASRDTDGPLGSTVRVYDLKRLDDDVEVTIHHWAVHIKEGCLVTFRMRNESEKPGCWYGTLDRFALAEPIA